MEKKHIIIAAIVFIALVIGLIWLAGQDAETAGQTTDDRFVSYAQELGLDTEKFRADLSSDAVTKKIESDQEAGNAAGLEGTPTIALNGTRIDIPRTSDALLAIVNTAKESVDTEVVRDLDHVKGNTEGAVTIVEYSDFQCPACRSYAPTIRALLEKTDDVRFIYRHYPLTRIHPNAMAAARAAESAGNQGKFWEMHDLLFEHQNEWDNL